MRKLLILVAIPLMALLLLPPFEARGPMAVADPVDAGASDQEIWRPPAGATFQWQLQGKVDTSIDADVYDVDGFDSSKSLVASLHDDGRKVVCYLSAGSYERWRPDAGDFPKKILGRPLDGWPGERWLDVRKLRPLRKIMNARLDMCASKGFDAVEYDNVDGFTNKTGFPLTRKHQVAYLDYLSTAAHDRGLAAGLKNLPQLASKLEPEWDFVVNEQCFQYDECEGYSVFIAADKAVFNVEYELKLTEFCDEAAVLGTTSQRKKYSLRAWHRRCP